MPNCFEKKNRAAISNILGSSLINIKLNLSREFLDIRLISVQSVLQLSYVVSEHYVRHK